MEKNNGNIPKQLNFFNKYIALKLWFTMENYGTKKKAMILWKNYGTMDKTMMLYRKLWNFDLLRKKLWCYSKL